MRLFTLSRLLLAVFVFHGTSMGFAASLENCDLSISKKTLRSTAAGQTAMWTFSTESLARGPYTLSSRAEEDHARWVRGKTSWSSRDNLANGILIRKRAVDGLSPRDSFRLSLERDIRNLSKIIDGKVGRIRALRCLEGLAFKEYLKVTDLRSHPQEFQALFMEKNGTVVMLGDFYRKNQSDTVGTSPSAETLRQRARLLRQGWTYHAHLHNHPFDFKNPYGDIGGSLAPSDADLAVYLTERPLYAWITNGLETIEIPRKDFFLLEKAK